LELPATWDEYLATLSSTRRQTVRRKERKLAKEYAVHVTDYDTTTLDEGWARLSALHSERWAGVTAFSPRVAELHREFARSLAQRGALWLSTLELNGMPAAAWYGFTDGDTVHFFQSGRSAEHEGDSVGQVLMGMMIRRAIERGYRRFDFLRGDEPYKATWTSQRSVTWELTAFRPGWKGRWLRGWHRADAARRHLRARVKSALVRRVSR
jgi:CelD/BcsL family acetyltransferase involved in cellulose biosynthesis